MPDNTKQILKAMEENPKLGALLLLAMISADQKRGQNTLSNLEVGQSAQTQSEEHCPWYLNGEIMFFVISGIVAVVLYALPHFLK